MLVHTPPSLFASLHLSRPAIKFDAKPCDVAKLRVATPPCRWCMVQYLGLCGLAGALRTATAGCFRLPWPGPGVGVHTCMQSNQTNGSRSLRHAPLPSTLSFVYVGKFYMSCPVLSLRVRFDAGHMTGNTYICCRMAASHGQGQNTFPPSFNPCVF